MEETRNFPNEPGVITLIRIMTGKSLDCLAEAKSAFPSISAGIIRTEEIVQFLLWEGTDFAPTLLI